MDIGVIKDDTTYEAAMARANELIAFDPAPDSKSGR